MKSNLFISNLKMHKVYKQKWYKLEKFRFVRLYDLAKHNFSVFGWSIKRNPEGTNITEKETILIK